MLSDYTRTFEKEVLPLLRKQNGFKDEITFSSLGDTEVTEISLWDSFSVCSHPFNRLIYSAYLKFSVYRPITRTEVLDENHHTVPTLSKTTPPEPLLEHAIRLRAYELYAQRQTAEGHAVQD